MFVEKTFQMNSSQTFFFEFFTNIVCTLSVYDPFAKVVDIMLKPSVVKDLQTYLWSATMSDTEDGVVRAGLKL